MAPEPLDARLRRLSFDPEAPGVRFAAAALVARADACGYSPDHVLAPGGVPLPLHALVDTARGCRALAAHADLHPCERSDPLWLLEGLRSERYGPWRQPRGAWSVDCEAGRKIDRAFETAAVHMEIAFDRVQRTLAEARAGAGRERVAPEVLSGALSDAAAGISPEIPSHEDQKRFLLTARVLVALDTLARDVREHPLGLDAASADERARRVRHIHEAMAPPAPVPPDGALRPAGPDPRSYAALLVAGADPFPGLRLCDQVLMLRLARPGPHADLAPDSLGARARGLLLTAAGDVDRAHEERLARAARTVAEVAPAIGLDRAGRAGAPALDEAVAALGGALSRGDVPGALRAARAGLQALDRLDPAALPVSNDPRLVPFRAALEHVRDAAEPLLERRTEALFASTAPPVPGPSGPASARGRSPAD